MNILISTAGFTKHEWGNISIRFANLSEFLVVNEMAIGNMNEVVSSFMKHSLIKECDESLLCQHSLAFVTALSGGVLSEVFRYWTSQFFMLYSKQNRGRFS